MIASTEVFHQVSTLEKVGNLQESNAQQDQRVWNVNERVSCIQIRLNSSYRS